MFNQELTIINKVYDKKTHQNTYKTSFVHGFWSSSDGISISGVNLVKNKGFKAVILMSEQGYVNPKEYIGEGWTLKNDDYIVKGIVEEVTTITKVIDSYECMKITNVAIKDYGSEDMYHFEVSGE